MGNSSSTDDVEDRVGFVGLVRCPLDDQLDPGIYTPYDNDRFSQEIVSTYDLIRKAINKRSKEEDKQCRFFDCEFPAIDESLYLKKISDWEGIKWKSPHELSKQPKLVKGGLVYNDIEQGQLGDCWWMSSVAAVCRIPRFIKRIIPSDQSLAGSDYIGAFHFRFWRFGHWIDVVVDDKLPTKNGSLFFARSTDPDEFWISLLEKAYAKIHGTYQALDGGFAQDALEDLTGGLAVTHPLKENTPKNLYSMLLKACKNETFVCCATDVDGKGEDKKLGLVSRHAYTVTDAKKIQYRGRMTPLVRVRNPWGEQMKGRNEWKGDWSDSSSTWSEVDQREKNRLGYKKDDNGEWWMNFEDFKTYFNKVTFCTMGPDFDSDGVKTGDKWYLYEAVGSWTKGKTAGGCKNSMEKFATNPQYYLELREPDHYDATVDEPESKGKCAVVIGLMQEYRDWDLRNIQRLKNHYIGFSVYKVKSKPLRRLEVNDFPRNPCLQSKYPNLREVSATSLMSPGHYVIVPSTFCPDKVSSYLLRIYTEQEINLEKLRRK